MAPYNFVPLPNECFSVQDGLDVQGQKIKLWDRHDELIPGTHSGWIKLDIETLTPLYIRGPVTRNDTKWDDRESRLRPEPFTSAAGIPLIPGSSLRGMVRSLVEILSFAKIQPVTAVKPFFRTVAADRIGTAYRERMMRDGNKPPGGLLRVESDILTIEPRDVLGIDRRKLPKGTIHAGPNYSPPWPTQHATCWVTTGAASKEVSEIRIQEHRPSEPGSWRRGTLVLTGNAPKKKREFVFLDPEETPPRSIRVPDHVWDRFHDKDQITQWQERAFPKDTPSARCRKAPGHLRDGEPVFFLTAESAKSDDNPDGLVFLGRARMFRFPYDLSPKDLIPRQLNEAHLDLAEAMFGRVGKEPGSENQAVKGRVYFEDAVAVMGDPPWTEDILVPRILSAPKPTTFQHYLTQEGPGNAKDLTTYLGGDDTTIRGHKLYWHRWDGAQGLAAVREPDDHDGKRADLMAGKGERHTQHTVIAPVKAGVIFRGRIRFDNLTDLELGALLTALQLPEECGHKIGMGKPLGLGSVRTKARLELLDRGRRYSRWNCSGVTEHDGGSFRDVFATAMIEHARKSDETLVTSKGGLRQIARIDALFCLLDWKSRPNFADTRYMLIEGGDSQRYAPDKSGNGNEFRSRPVLPTPHRVAERVEPSWPDNPARPGTAPGRGTSPKAATAQPTTAKVSQPPRQAKAVQQGQVRTGTLHRKGDRWAARFKGDERDAVIVNDSAVEVDIAEGSSAEFYITAQSKRIGIKARFERLILT
jgi:CRISPR-associated protein (TIGR03986 family)